MNNDKTPTTDDLEQLLREMAPIWAGITAPAESATPERIMELREALAAMKRSDTLPKRAQSELSTLVPREQMQALLLHMLNGRAMNGLDIIGALQRSRVSPAGGYGCIYGLLRKLRSLGYIEQMQRHTSDGLVMSFSLTKRGEKTLKTSKVAPELSNLLESLSAPC
jgi:DNA-binding PadR family transcriptional regulator